MSYEVLLLVEEPVSEWDARQIIALHHDVAEPVRYRILLPAEDAAGRVESTLGTLSSPMMDAGVGPAYSAETAETATEELLAECRASLDGSVASFTRHGAQAEGELVTTDPLRHLYAVAEADDPAEVIVLTRPHVVAEMMGLDWSSRARRHLDVPVLHLLAQTAPDWELLDERAHAGTPSPIEDPGIPGVDDPPPPDPNTSEAPRP